MIIDPLKVRPAPPVGLHALARWPVLTIAGVLALVHAVAGAFGDYWIDEVYMLAAGKYHPNWGYVDQPPLTPLLAAAMDFIAPDSMFALRLPAALATGGAVVLIALLARELGADRRAQTIAALAGATGLWSNLIGHWTAPYTFEPLLWSALLVPLVRWLRQHSEGVADDRLLLVFGVLLGINLQVKFQVVLLCVALLVSALAVGPRAVLTRPMLWAGTGVALLIASPTLIWQAVNGWPQLAMSAVVAQESPMLSGGRDGTAVQLVLYAGVLGTALVLGGLWLLLREPWLRPYRMFAVTAILLWAFFVATAGRPYYLIGMYGLPIAAAVVGLQRRRQAKPPRWGWAAWPVYALSVATAGMLVFAGAAINQTFSTALTKIDSGKVSERIARDVSGAYLTLPAEQRTRTAVIGDSYIAGAMLDVGSAHHPLPEVFSPHRGYGYFDAPTDEIDTVVYYGRDVESLRPYFTDIRPAIPGEDLKGWIATGRTQPWAAIWPQLTSLS